MNYESMSEFELNKLFAERVGYLVQEIDDSSMIGMNSKFHENYPNTVWVAEMDCSTCEQSSAWEQKCFTRIVEDIWPVILESEIGLNKLKAEPVWLASNNKGDYARNENPLLAAVIVYLMMSES